MHPNLPNRPTFQHQRQIERASKNLTTHPELIRVCRAVPKGSTQSSKVAEKTIEREKIDPCHGRYKTPQNACVCLFPGMGVFDWMTPESKTQRTGCHRVILWRRWTHWIHWAIVGKWLGARLAASYPSVGATQAQDQCTRRI